MNTNTAITEISQGRQGSVIHIQYDSSLIIGVRKTDRLYRIRQKDQVIKEITSRTFNNWDPKNVADFPSIFQPKSLPRPGKEVSATYIQNSAPLVKKIFQMKKNVLHIGANE
jgi:hypothetical protein